MVITPDSIIKLYRDVDICDDERLVFSSDEKKNAYFNNRLVKTINECTIVKQQTGVIRIEIPGAMASRCNYMSFINPSFENKEIYCRITLMPEYTNNECTQFAYEIDYWMSFYKDVKFEDMYIDREHLSQSKFELSRLNPYHRDLWEFRTEEPLPISEDTEKLFYNTSIDDQSGDGTYMYAYAAKNPVDIPVGVSSSKTTAYYDLIYVSDIDFEALDANVTEGTPPSERWERFANDAYDFRIQYKTRPFLQAGAELARLLGGGVSDRIGVDSKIRPPYTILGVCSHTYTPEGDGQPVGKTDEIIDYLTKWGVVSNVMNIYRVPAYLVRAAFVYVTESGTLIPDELPIFFDARTSENLTDTVRNTKLCNFPFSYMRTMSPDNSEIKEFRYERFKEVAESGVVNDTTKCRFTLAADLTENFKAVVMPFDYKYDVGTSLRNAFILNKFPTMPYSIDSWLAQMAANAQSIIAGNTTEYMYSMGQEQIANYQRAVSNQFAAVNAGGSVISGIGEILSGNIGGGVNTILGGTQNAANLPAMQMSLDLANQSLQNRANMSQNAYNALAGQTEGNAVYSNFVETRPAYAANKYVAGGGDGVIYYNKYSVLDVMLLHVTLNDEVLERYDKWFDNFGYSSGRCGIPYACQFAQGETNDDNIPHFHEMSDGKLTTYLKTNNARVTHTQAVVSNAIKNLLNNGVRFVKGDEL